MGGQTLPYRTPSCSFTCDQLNAMPGNDVAEESSMVRHDPEVGVDAREGSP